MSTKNKKQSEASANGHKPEPQLKVKPKRGSKSGLSDEAITGLDLGELGSAEVVSIADVNVDLDYQRDLRHQLVNEIGREYDIVKAGAILLNERDDKYGGGLWCVDGQHRMAGAAQAGETEIFAHVTHGLTPEEESSLRLARNKRAPDSVYEKLKARLHTGDPQAKAMLRICEDAGTTLNLAPDTNGGINAIAAVEALYRADGHGDWLRRTLKLLSEAFGENPGPKILSSNLMKATAWFMAMHFRGQEANYAETVQRLKENGVDDLRRKALAHKAAMGGAEWMNYYRAMVVVYNHGRSETKRLKWKTTGSITTLGSVGQTGQGKMRRSGSY